MGFLDADYDMLTKVGSPTSIHDLQDIGVKNVDLFIAVTPVETENITSCLIANQLGAKRTPRVSTTTSICCPATKVSLSRWG